MKKAIKISALLLALVVSLQISAQAQSRSSRQESSNDFASQLWYGGGINVGFTGNSFESIFQLGLSPMVGYKLFDEFSIGPRVAVQYIHYRTDLGGRGVETANPVSWAAGVFSRYKFFPTIFAHVEYEFENAAVFTIGADGLEVLRRERNNFYIGAGYNSGGEWGYEILVLYNTLQPENDINPPFNFRFGITRNF